MKVLFGLTLRKFLCFEVVEFFYLVKDGCSVIGTPQNRNKSDNLSENEDVEMIPSQNPVTPKNSHERELPVYEPDLIQEEAEKLAATPDEEMNSNEEIFSTFEKKDSLMPNRRNHQAKEPEIIGKFKIIKF